MHQLAIGWYLELDNLEVDIKIIILEKIYKIKRIKFKKLISKIILYLTLFK